MAFAPGQHPPLPRTQRPVIVTKKGRPLVQVVPINDEPREVFGALAGEIEVLGDLVAPVLPASAWKTDKSEKSEK